MGLFGSWLAGFEYGRELLPGIRALNAAGHTPGHTAFLLESRGERLLCLGDSFYDPLQLSHPGWSTPWDHDPRAAARSRRRFLDQPCRMICSCTRTTCPFRASAGSGASMARTRGARRRREPEPASFQLPAAGGDCPHICLRFKLNGPEIAAGIRSSHVLRVIRSAECDTGE
jgi:glyoxylase-like metal-dependent hydrolase (beta-lactamase superfamily II)